MIADGNANRRTREIGMDREYVPASAAEVVVIDGVKAGVVFQDASHPSEFWVAYMSGAAKSFRTREEARDSVVRDHATDIDEQDAAILTALAAATGDEPVSLTHLHMSGSERTNRLDELERKGYAVCRYGLHTITRAGRQRVGGSRNPAAVQELCRATQGNMDETA